MSACVSRLQQLRADGFTIVLNYSSLYGTSDEVRQYAAAAASLGIRLIWPLHHPALRAGTGAQAYLQLGRECGCTATPDLVRYIVSVLKDLPATYMYYVGDEVPDAQHAAVRGISDLIHTLDPAHPRFYVTFGSNVTGQSLSAFTDTADVLGGDSYPIEVGGDASTVAADTRTTARIATAAERPYAMVLQAFCFCQEGHAGARYPTRAEYRQMLANALAAGRPSFVLWWAYYRLLQSDDPPARIGDFLSGVFGPADPPAASVQPARIRNLLSLRLLRRRGRAPALLVSVRQATRARLVARRGPRRLTAPIRFAAGTARRPLPAAIAHRLTPGRWTLTVSAGDEALSRAATIPRARRLP